MFRRKANTSQTNAAPPVQRITSVVADGVSLRGKLSGAGGVRIEGAFHGEIDLDGLFVIGPTGRVDCPQLKARHVIVAGAMRGDILAERVEIRASGRVWGNVTAVSMSTEEGAFLRGEIRMEEKIELIIEQPAAAAADGTEATQSPNDGSAEHQTKPEEKAAEVAKPMPGKFKRKTKN
ncbi:MAG: polymer-forming cytoskeletal protein [Anaerolineales bacterium]